MPLGHFRPRTFWLEHARQELLRHRRREAIPPAPRQRRHDHRRVHVALVIRRKDNWPFEVLQVLTAVDVDPGEYASER
jgi:hypothetical protein